MRAVIALGANLGDPLATLREAVAAVSGLGAIVAVSSVYDTDPIGGPDQPVYCNAVLLLETDLRPEALLSALQGIEHDHGRTRDVRWGARTLDLDIIDVDGRVSDDPQLTLPHPRAHERGFVLLPWLEIDPLAVIAGAGPVRTLVDAVSGQGVRRRTGADALTVKA